MVQRGPESFKSVSDAFLEREQGMVKYAGRVLYSPGTRR